MDFNEYQDKAATTAIFLETVREKHPDLPKDIEDYLSLAYLSLGLGESGEVQGKVKKVLRDAGGVLTDKARTEIAKELGDILWYLSGTCTQLGIRLEDVADKNIEKLFSRKDRNQLTGNGDNR